MTRISTFPIGALMAIAAASTASAHDDHCAAVTESVAEAGFDDRVTVTCTDSHAVIRSDTYPDHEKMTGIVGTNEQVPVPADYAAPILLAPTLGTTPLTRDAALGIAGNGVPIYDYRGGGEMSQADLAQMMFAGFVLPPLGQLRFGLAGHVGVIIGGVEKQAIGSRRLSLPNALKE